MTRKAQTHAPPRPHLRQITRCLGPAVSTELMNYEPVGRKLGSETLGACRDQFTVRLIVVVPLTVPEVAVTVMV